MMLLAHRYRMLEFEELKDDFQSVLRTLKFVYDFCFVSYKTSQNVAFHIYLHEVNSKFQINRHYRCEALCFIFSDIT